MSITGEQVETAIKIVKLLLKVKNITHPTVNDVINHAKYAAEAFDGMDDKGRTQLSDAVIGKMITIKAEVQ